MKFLLVVFLAIASLAVAAQIVSAQSNAKHIETNGDGLRSCESSDLDCNCSGCKQCDGCDKCTSQGGLFKLKFSDRFLREDFPGRFVREGYSCETKHGELSCVNCAITEKCQKCSWKGENTMTRQCSLNSWQFMKSYWAKAGGNQKLIKHNLFPVNCFKLCWTKWPSQDSLQVKESSRSWLAAVVLSQIIRTHLYRYSD